MKYHMFGKDYDGDYVSRDYVFTDKDHAHSSHLRKIMQDLDLYGWDLISITVHSDECEGACHE